MVDSIQKLYLDIVRKGILGLLYQDPSVAPDGSGLLEFNNELRESGEDWPCMAHTMIGNKRMLNIQHLAEDIIKNDIPGDFIETGVWRGGACIFMQAILKAYNITDRSVWVCDSFQGLPAPNVDLYPQDSDANFHNFSFLSVSVDEVIENFRRYNLLTPQVKFVVGWFSDTLPTIAADKLALLRLDGDMYESTMVALENLYPKLSVGGYIIIDDYQIIYCKQAVADYREKHNITDELQHIDNFSMFWQKG